MKLGKPSRLRTLKSPEPNSLILESRAIHTLLTLFQSNRSSAYRAKLAYISLNIPTACPPRTAVSVNRPFCDRRRCWVTFRHKFDKVCDLPNDVAKNRILFSVRSASRISSLMTGVDRIYTCGEKEHLAGIERDGKGAPINEVLQKQLIQMRDEQGLTQYRFPFE